MKVLLFLAALAPTAASADEVVWQSGNWKHKIIVDLITDEPRSIMSNVSKDAGIALKCDRRGEGRVYAQFASRTYLGDGDRGLIYRIDGEMPVETEWAYDGRQALLTNERQFARDLIGGQKLAIRAIESDFSVTDAAFDITGADEAISRLYEACGDVAP